MGRRSGGRILGDVGGGLVKKLLKLELELELFRNLGKAEFHAIVI